MDLVKLLGTRKLRWMLLPAIYQISRLFGVRFIHFYRWMLNLQERNLHLDDILRMPESPGKYKGFYDWGRGKYHVDFMIRHGLKPSDRVLDFGCGYGRTAIPLIKYVDPGNYFGVEITDRRLEMAKEWAARENLAVKKPNFIHSLDKSVGYLADNSVNVVWSMAVFNHMPNEDMHELLKSMRRILSPSGKFYLHYTIAAEKRSETARPTVKDFYRTDAHMQRVCKNAGFDFSYLKDWDSDLGDKAHGNDRVMLLVRDTAARQQA